MAPKTLEEGSKYAHFDKDGDGVITDEEFMLEREMMRAENEDAKEDQIRKMVGSLCGDFLFTLSVLLLQTWLVMKLLDSYLQILHLRILSQSLL